jgi:signal transduction histidine kinase
MAATVLGLVLGACGDSHESVVDEQFDVMEEMLDILDGVTDEASAKEAGKELEALGEKLADLQKRMEKMPKPTPEQKKRLQAILTERQADFKKRSQTVLSKMMKYPELAQAFSKSMEK